MKCHHQDLIISANWVASIYHFQMSKYSTAMLLSNLCNGSLANANSHFKLHNYKYISFTFVFLETIDIDILNRNSFRQWVFYVQLQYMVAISSFVC